MGLASSASFTASMLSWVRPVLLLLPEFLAFLFRLVPYYSYFRTLSHNLAFSLGVLVLENVVEIIDELQGNCESQNTF